MYKRQQQTVAVDAMTEEEEMAADAVMIADLQIIAACGLSYCLSAVADIDVYKRQRLDREV